MNVFEAISRRYSCRSYRDQPIEPQKLQQILEAARLAPSARNLQDWRLVVVTDKQLRLKLAQAANNQMFIAEAPVTIVACSNSDHIMRCGQPVAPIDVAIALEHIALQAVQEGLATCWIGSFYADKVQKLLAIPPEVTIVELMSLGYPADKPQARGRLPLDAIVCREKWAFAD